MIRNLQEAIEQDGRLRLFAAAEAVIVVRTPLAMFKIARISFGKRDGSIYLQFPYLKEKEGILAARGRKGFWIVRH